MVGILGEEAVDSGACLKDDDGAFASTVSFKV